MENCYCSVQFQTGEELDEALLKAKTACDEADKAVAARTAIENMKVEAVALSAGATPTVEKTTEDGVVKLTFGLAPGARGETGQTGRSGADGVGISGINTTYDSGWRRTRVTIYLTNGNAESFYVYDGQGIKEVYDTYNSTNKCTEVGIVLENGAETTFQIPDGRTGAAGADGYTPVRGTDYWTETDKQEIIDEVLAQGGGTGEAGSDGKDGEDGVSPTVAVTTIEGGHRLTITDVDGTKTVDVMDGVDGTNGKDGTDGYTPVKGVDYFDGADGSDGAAGKDGTSVTVKNVSESTADGGSNVVTFSDGKTVTIKNGSKGSAGADGAKGDKGDTGAAGKDGSAGADGVGVASIKQTTTSSADGGSNVFTVTLTNGTSATFAVKNGSKGSAGAAGADGHTPVKGTDYWTAADKAEIVDEAATEAAAKVSVPTIVQETGTSETAVMSQKAVTDALTKREQLAPEYAESAEWLEANGDTSKMYVLPDGFIYAYRLTEVEAGPSYTNVLPLAINADGTPYVGTNGEKGYKVGWRINSSDVEKEASGRCCTGFIAAKSSDTIRIKNMYHPTDNNMNGYIVIYNSSFAKIASGYENTSFKFVNGECEFVVNNITMASGTVADMAYFRISTGVISDESIITINEEIAEGGGTTSGYAWANTGLAFVPADYEDRIVALESDVDELKEAVENIGKDVEVDKIALIKAWDAPIYDDAPVFLLDEDKPAMGTSTVAAVYAKYDALMAQHPGYITKTDLGLASDGVTHIYRYDFCEPRTRNNPETRNPPDLTKPKAIIVSGIHIEFAGIYALYHALEEIASNAELYQSLRKNTHLIVIPCLNPYCLDSANYDASNGRKNANGVEIHRNFEVDHVVVNSSSNNYGGEAPLSEVESQYLDNIMAENPDAAFFLTCHNFDSDTYFGSGFIWPSVATNYMYNMGSRLIDKMSKAWLDKYGDTFRNGVDTVKTDSVADGDYTVGMVGISNSPGTETKQALKYGIHGTNVEIAKVFSVFNSTIGSSEVMTHGAEVYINFLLTAFGCYDHKDKAEYSG